MKRLVMLGVIMLLVGCEPSASEEPVGVTATRQQAVESTEHESVEPVQELRSEPPPYVHLPPIPASAFPPPEPPPPPRTTEEKLASPDWPAELAAKEATKSAELAKANTGIAHVPTADPAMIPKQERFFELVRERQAEFDAMDPETRAAVYEEIKRKELGE